MSTITKHYEALLERDQQRCLAMHGQLALQMYQSKDCYTYFKRSILDKEAKKGTKIRIVVLPYWILYQFVEFFGFTWEEIYNNTIPELKTEKELVMA